MCKAIHVQGWKLKKIIRKEIREILGNNLQNILNRYIYIFFFPLAPVQRFKTKEKQNKTNKMNANNYGRKQTDKPNSAVRFVCLEKLQRKNHTGQIRPHADSIMEVH